MDLVARHKFSVDISHDQGASAVHFIHVGRLQSPVLILPELSVEQENLVLV